MSPAGGGRYDTRFKEIMKQVYGEKWRNLFTDANLDKFYEVYELSQAHGYDIGCRRRAADPVNIPQQEPGVITEHRIMQPGGKKWAGKNMIRVDFAGFGDILAWNANQLKGILAINVCGSDIYEHTKRYKDPTHTRGRRKQVVRDRILGWIAAGNTFELWAWELQGPLATMHTFRATSEDGRVLNFPMVEEPTLWS